jgi:osmotically-inducible protein OsmY
MEAKERTDAQLKVVVTHELKRDGRVDETDIGVEVHGGVVTLTGTVDNWVAYAAAQEAAHRGAGVLDVVNNVRVKLPGSVVRDDTDIALDVRRALECDVRVPHERIRATVSNGTVTLDGNVAQWSQHDDAGRCVRNLAGVRDVRNLIRVDPPPPLASITELQRAIENAMSRHAAHAVKHVQISTVDGIVTLRGHVASWADRSAVEGAVRGTPGVRKIDNQIRVEE